MTGHYLQCFEKDKEFFVCHLGCETSDIKEGYKLNIHYKNCHNETIKHKDNHKDRKDEKQKKFICFKCNIFETIYL